MRPGVAAAAWIFGGLARPLILLFAFCVGTAAHANEKLTLSSSPAQRCLIPAEAQRIKPDYPPDMLRLKESALIHAELVFSAPDDAPDVKVEGDPPSDFVAAVRAYAKQLRVPCMSRGDRPVKLRQDFVFTPNDGRKVAWSTPTDEADATRQKFMACVVMPLDGNTGIEYPLGPLREGKEGKVVVRLHFSDPAKPPTPEILDNGGSKYFVQAISGFMEKMRMGCLGSEPVDVQFIYTFKIEDARQREVLNDLTLPQFLRVVKPISPGSAFFDTTVMKCPFDLRLTFEQPWAPNKIEELDDDVPVRHPFMDWLAAQQFEVTPRQANALLTQQMTLHIPCARIDL